MLAALDAAESALDPGFARRLRGGPPRRLPWLLVSALATAGLLLLVLPGAGVLVVAAILAFVVVPGFLVAWALHQDDPLPG